MCSSDLDLSVGAQAGSLLGGLPDDARGPGVGVGCPLLSLDARVGDQLVGIALRDAGELTGLPRGVLQDAGSVGAGLVEAVPRELQLRCRFVAFPLHLGRPCPDGVGLRLRLLPQAVGEGWARRLAQTGELVSAARALQIGLVDELTDAGLAKIVAVSVADQGHFSSPGAARANRQLLRGGLDAMQAAQSKEMAATLSCLGSIEQVEGVLAFFEKRAPSWRDDNDA